MGDWVQRAQGTKHEFRLQAFKKEKHFVAEDQIQRVALESRFCATRRVSTPHHGAPRWFEYKSIMSGYELPQQGRPILGGAEDAGAQTLTHLVMRLSRRAAHPDSDALRDRLEHGLESVFKGRGAGIHYG